MSKIVCFSLDSQDQTAQFFRSLAIYTKEVKNSFEIAKMYREKINPIDRVFPSGDISDLREKIIRKVKAELNLRIMNGYTNIDISLVEEFVNNYLRELGVI